MHVRGKRDGVPVSWLLFKYSCRNFANWPNSAGMGPGVYKTQSKHTKNKSPYPTGTIWLRNASRKRDGVPVSWLLFNHSFSNFANWPNSAGIGPGVYKTQSKHTKNKSRYRTGTISLRNASLCLNIEGKSGGKKDGVPVSWFWFKISTVKFANWPNSAGMGPGVYKTMSKYTKTKSRYRTGTISLGNASLRLNIKGKSGGRGIENR